MSKLWYNSPAGEWEQALPIGNGRLGGMVFGHVKNEIIQLNEESIWYGGPVDRINPDAKWALPKVRELIFSGQIDKAEELMSYAFTGCPEGMHPYQTLGNLYLNFREDDECEDYHRELDLDSAICKVRYKRGTQTYSRQVFASHSCDAIIIYLSADEGGALNFTACLGRDKFFDGVKKSGDHGIYMYGNLGKGGIDFGVTLTAKVRDGQLRVIGDKIRVDDATEAVLFLTANTSFHLGEGADIEEANLNTLMQAEEKKYSILVKEHMDDYQALYNRVNFSLGDTDLFDAVPTDERIKKAATRKGPDIGLSKLFFDYGRYLLISCSRPGNLPATLQGLWNKDYLPPWDSKYTVNINAQMNYWPAEICNLTECHEPLFDHIKRLIPNGEKTASEMYGCRGFVCHHNTDIWGDTNPQDTWIPGTYWVMGAAWLCTHLWTHYEYTYDKDFLAEYYPIMKEAALFFVDFLVEKDGFLVTCPSVSPENTFILKNGQQGANIYGVTMDNQILRDLFTQCIDAAGILEIEDDFTNTLKEMREKLIPTQIGINGNIMEWPEDFEEVEPGHRHISHLYGLYPSNQITVDKTPELAEAAKVTLERRLSQGGGHTGWSRAWIINHYAKLWDRDKAYENLKQLFKNSVYDNLFDKHPPFQIDGNFGACAAIANMLVQSDEDRIVILPALPKAWKNGSISGLKVVGDGTISIEWKNGRLINLSISFAKERKTSLRFGDDTYECSFDAGQTREYKVNLVGKLKEKV